MARHLTIMKLSFLFLCLRDCGLQGLCTNAKECPSEVDDQISDSSEKSPGEQQRWGGKLRAGENIPWNHPPKKGFGPPSRIFLSIPIRPPTSDDLRSVLRWGKSLVSKPAFPSYGEWRPPDCGGSSFVLTRFSYFPFEAPGSLTVKTSRGLKKLPVQHRRAEMSPKCSTSTGNTFWGFSRIF